MELRFPWNMALLYSSRVFFQLSWCCFQALWPGYQLMQLWQRAIDERFTLPLAISQIISRHTAMSLSLICPRDYDSTRSIHIMKHVVLVLKDPDGLIWPMIVTMQKWFMIFNLLTQDHQYLAVQLLWEGYALSRLWFHAFEIRLQ